MTIVGSDGTPFERPQSDARYGDTSRKQIKGLFQEINRGMTEGCFGVVVMVTNGEDGRPEVTVTPFSRGVYSREALSACLIGLTKAVLGYVEEQSMAAGLQREIGRMLQGMGQRSDEPPEEPGGRLHLHRP